VRVTAAYFAPSWREMPFEIVAPSFARRPAPRPSHRTNSTPAASRLLSRLSRPRLAAIDCDVLGEPPACAQAAAAGGGGQWQRQGEKVAWYFLSSKNFNKLIGKDVIVAHQLLKNDIALHEYWLVTPPVAGRHSAPAGFATWMEWNNSAIHTDSGAIPFHYTHIGQLKNELVPEPLPQLALASKTKVLSFSREYDTDIRTLFHATGDFHYRSRWQEGVKTVEEIGHFLPRVGMKCRCVMGDGQVCIYSSSYAFSGERIEFSETDERQMTATYFTLKQTGHKKTQLTIDVYLRKSRARLAWFMLTSRKKMIERYTKSLRNLDRLVQDIKLPG
jgi:hypothetical protein